MLREFMKRLFNRQDKTTKVVNQIDEVYKKSLEDDEIKDEVLTKCSTKSYRIC